MTLIILLLVLAAVCAVLALAGVATRINLTALGLLLVVLALVVEAVGLQ